jgi:hypothetical protein
MLSFSLSLFSLFSLSLSLSLLLTVFMLAFLTFSVLPPSRRLIYEPIYNGGVPVEGAWQTSTISDPASKFWIRQWVPAPSKNLDSYLTLEQWYSDSRLDISDATYVYAVNFG